MSSSQIERFSWRRQVQRALVDQLEAAPHSDVMLMQQLRALQISGMSDTDIRIFLEAERVEHQNSLNADEFDDAAIAALDLITGLRTGLELDDAARCAAALPHVLSAGDYLRAMDHAFEASDLLPVNRSTEVEPEVKTQLAELLFESVSADHYRPQRAHFTRAPKRRFVTRPAASLSLQDRVVYQALADKASALLRDRLPASVLWPRPLVSSKEANSRFQSVSDDWETAYEVNADIESYFEYVDHSLLAYVLTTHIGLPARTASAVETFLNTVMSSTRGLPQGPAASDVFATAYLLPLDLTLKERGWTSARYQDDLKVAATGIADAKNTLRELEATLREFGLRLSQDKSYYVSLKNRVKRDEGYSTAPAQERAGEAKASRDSIRTGELLVEFQALSAQVFNKSSDPRVKKAESRLGAILTELAAGTGAGLGRRELSTVLDWFPQLAPEAAQYLGQRYAERPEDVSEFIQFRLKERREQDWENAWLVLAPDLSGRNLQPDLRGVLMAASRDESLPPLTRCNALKVLVRRGGPVDTADPAWIRGIPNPLLSELALETQQSAGGGWGFLALGSASST